MKCIGFLLLGGAFAFWIYALFSRGSSSNDSKYNGRTELALLFAYVGIAFVGFGHPLVERDGTVVLGATPAFLWTDALSASLVTLLLHHHLIESNSTNRSRFARIKYFAACALFFFIFNFGWLLFINAKADFKTPKHHKVQNTEKYFSVGQRSNLSYFLFFRDWRNPQKQVRLQVFGDLYNRCSKDDTFDLTVGQGALGVEWIKDVRLISKHRITSSARASSAWSH